MLRVSRVYAENVMNADVLGTSTTKYGSSLTVILSNAFEEQSILSEGRLASLRPHCTLSYLLGTRFTNQLCAFFVFLSQSRRFDFLLVSYPLNRPYHQPYSSQHPPLLSPSSPKKPPMNRCKMDCINRSRTIEKRRV